MLIFKAILKQDEARLGSRSRRLFFFTVKTNFLHGEEVVENFSDFPEKKKEVEKKLYPKTESLEKIIDKVFLSQDLNYIFFTKKRIFLLEYNFQPASEEDHESQGIILKSNVFSYKKISKIQSNMEMFPEIKIFNNKIILNLGDGGKINLDFGGKIDEMKSFHEFLLSKTL